MAEPKDPKGRPQQASITKGQSHKEVDKAGQGKGKNEKSGAANNDQSENERRGRNR